MISDDEARCARLARAFQSGIVWVNCSQPCFCHAPWGGVKKSGFGRELGTFGLENYQSVKRARARTRPPLPGARARARGG